MIWQLLGDSNPDHFHYLKAINVIREIDLNMLVTE